MIISKTIGLEQNKKFASVGRQISNNTRKNIESKLGKSIVTKKNVLDYKYQNQDKIDHK